MIQIFVPGHPKAQGSKRHVGKGVMVEMSKDLGPWRQAIAEKLKEAANGDKLFGPLRVRSAFYFQRPASHYRTGKYAGQLKRTAPKFRITQPDLDKLERALFDALTISGVIQDDKWIVISETEKLYGDPGVLVSVEEIA